MLLNADFSKKVIVRFNENAWTASPMPGVERKMLDRVGDEVARATSVVRFAPDSAFSAHTHDGGEEFLVLDGVFSDEHGDFPAGSYIRNPPTSHHTPSSHEGTTIFVKLHQFDPEDRTHVRIASHKAGGVAEAGRDGVTAVPLFEDSRETVRIEDYAPGATATVDGKGGLEVFVIEGDVTCDGEALSAWDWMRLPVGSTLVAKAGTNGAKVWIKSNHLRDMA